MKKLFFLLSTLMIGVMFQSCDKEDAKPEVEPEAPENGIEYVDLGLPSGTLWATCNFGATSPTNCGSYVGQYGISGVPTQSEWEELNNNCYKACNSDGSITFTSMTNKKSITFPAYGGYYNGDVLMDQERAKYWSSTIVETYSIPHKAYIERVCVATMIMGQDYISIYPEDNGSRSFKFFVRQVQRK